MSDQQFVNEMISQLIDSLSQELCLGEEHIKILIKKYIFKEVRYWIKHSSYFDLRAFMRKFKNKVYKSVKKLYKIYPDLDVSRPIKCNNYRMFYNLVMINLMTDFQYPRSFVENGIKVIEKDILKPYYRKYKNTAIKYDDFLKSYFKGKIVGHILGQLFTKAHEQTKDTVMW